mmetsp:Transcript_44586/g.129007  ORF Transcript_44586/g.129007 Transcript_44586/m.129007 type:complete len:373 (+) Transcript_44586:762-1880(+)
MLASLSHCIGPNVLARSLLGGSGLLRRAASCSLCRLFRCSSSSSWLPEPPDSEPLCFLASASCELRSSSSPTLLAAALPLPLPPPPLPPPPLPLPLPLPPLPLLPALPGETQAPQFSVHLACRSWRPLPRPFGRQHLREQPILPLRQLLHRALLCDISMIHDDNVVEIQNCLQSMGHCNQRRRRECRLDGLLDELLHVRVDRRGSLVEQQQPGLAQDHARQAHKLTLSKAQVATLIGDPMLELVTPFLDGVCEVHTLQRLPNSAVGIAAKWVEVVPEAAREQHWVLRHQANRAAKRGKTKSGNVHIVEQYPATTGLQDSQEDQQQARLATAGRSCNGHLVLLPEGEADALQDVARDVFVTSLEVLDLDMCPL